MEKAKSKIDRLCYVCYFFSFFLIIIIIFDCYLFTYGNLLSAKDSRKFFIFCTKKPSRLSAHLQNGDSFGL